MKKRDPDDMGGHKHRLKVWGQPNGFTQAGLFQAAQKLDGKHLHGTYLSRKCRFLLQAQQKRG